MQSVTSNAVAKYLNTIQTWSKDGVILYKIGRFVYGLFSYMTSGSSPIFITTVPYKPVADVRIALINNGLDCVSGQFIIYAKDGSVRLWKDGGGSFDKHGYNNSFMYIAQL